MFLTLDRLTAALAVEGRDRDSCRTIMVCLPGRDSVDDLCRYAEAGVDGMVVQPWFDAPNLQAKLDGVERFAEETIAPVYERLGFPLPARGSTP
jgi:hypothetical protein